MKVQDIITMAVVHKKMPISDVYGRTEINDAKHQLAILYDTACDKATVTIVCDTPDKLYDLPPEVLRISRVMYEGDEYDRRFYKKVDNQMKFDDAGSFAVTYTIEPPDVTTNTEEPKIHPAYHRTIALHVAAMELEEIKPARASKLEGQFYAEAAAINKKLRQPKRQGSYTPVPPFR